MEYTIQAILSILQIPMQLYVAYLSFLIYKQINHGNWWWLLGGAFTLMAARRVTALFVESGSLVAQLDKLFLPLTISILLVLGMIKMKNAAFKEHEAKVDAERNIQKLSKLTQKLE